VLHQDVAELQQHLLAVPHFQRIRQPEVAGAALDVQPQHRSGRARSAGRWGWTLIRHGAISIQSRLS
jgi:hypothetical protein